MEGKLSKNSWKWKFIKSSWKRKIEDAAGCYFFCYQTEMVLYGDDNGIEIQELAQL